MQTNNKHTFGGVMNKEFLFNMQCIMLSGKTPDVDFAILNQASICKPN